MNLAREIAKVMAEKYENQNEENTEIILIKNNGNTGGHCERRYFKKDVLYKIVFPTLLASLDHYMTVFVALYEGDTRSYPGTNHNGILAIYDEYSVDYCFFKFLKGAEYSFFTNLH